MTRGILVLENLLLKSNSIQKRENDIKIYEIVLPSLLLNANIQCIKHLHVTDGFRSCLPAFLTLSLVTCWSIIFFSIIKLEYMSETSVIMYVKLSFLNYIFLAL